MRRRHSGRILIALGLIIICSISALALAAPHVEGWARWLLVCGFIASGLWLITEYILLRRNSLRYLARIERAQSRALRSAPERMPIPLVMISTSQEVIWYNEKFQREVAQGEDLFGVRLQERIPLRPNALDHDDYVDIDMNDRHYRISFTDCVLDGTDARLLCFEDISEYVKLRRHFLDTRPCVLLIVIDNYEDLFNGTRQSERASVLASLEILFDRFLEGMDSIFCHLDEDRFLVLTEARHCLEMERAHFPVLDEARKIVVNGHTSLTLSIGVGRSGESLAQNERFAQQSLDMALGRGGDQVAIKTENGFSFYGGVSKGIEHKNKAKNRAVARDLHKLMMRCNHVYIMGHRASDLDAVGAAVGIAFIATQTGIPYNIVIRQETTLAKLLTDRIKQEMPRAMISPETAREQFNEEDLLVVVDTFSKDIVEDPELYRMAKHVVVIDHHRQMVNYMENTTLKLHDPYASSAAELVTGMIQYFEWRDQMPQFCAEALLAGIMLDTKNFVMQTGVHTFEAAAFLRERGADPIAVKALFAESMSAYKERSRLVAEAEIYKRYAIAVEHEDVSDIQIIASQTADELLGIEGVDASFVIYPKGKLACVSARSLGKMNVQVVMERLGGGGHQIMAAAQLENETPATLRKMLIAALDEEDKKPEESPAKKSKQEERKS